MEPETTERSNPRSFVMYSLLALGSILIVAVAFISFATYLNSAPEGTQYPTSFTIEPGTDARTIGLQLYLDGLIRSEAYFNFILSSFFDTTSIKASTYVVDEPLTAFEIAEKLIAGDFGNNLVRFTHIEGESVNKLAERAEQLPEIDRDTFIAAALPFEGRLFPDTYFIRADFDTDELVSLLLESFDEAIEPLAAEIEASNFTLEQILILASIIEREANTPESMRLVSSVFQNRIAIGMPLQADASIEYILDKPLNELTPEDLEIDSPYNTYVNPGLPPTPIGNPGLQAIEAVLDPEESPYLFYITGNDGEFYFAETYNQHLINIDRYLR